MTVSIEIVPISSSVDMYGKADVRSAYSLSGHVSISVLSSYFVFNRTRKTDLLLQSLELTFEGQTEVHAGDMGYCSTRLCRITKQLVQQEPVLLSTDGILNDSEPCYWNMVFNLTVPGWLPASAGYGPDGTLGVTYNLFATAKFVILNSRSRCDSWTTGISSLCSSIWPPERVVDAEKRIIVRRFASPPSSSTEGPVIENTTFLIKPEVQLPAEASKPYIPLDVWSKLQILVSVPEYTDTKSEKLPFTLRIRTMNMKSEDRKRLQFMGFSIDVHQKEKCRQTPTAEYATRYSLPTEQPPALPLRRPHRLGYVYESLSITPSHGGGEQARTFSLLSPASNGQYQAEGPNYIFADTEIESTSWFTLQCAVPLSSPDASHVDSTSYWAGNSVRRPTSVSPLLSIRHQVSIRLTFGYDCPDLEGTAWEAFAFNVPVRFERIAQKLPKPTITSSISLFASSVTGEAIQQEETSCPPVLPAYSELFYANGDRKLDPTPLPLYSPPGAPVPTPEDIPTTSLPSFKASTEEKTSCDLRANDSMYVS
ncbi:hypothetical protein L218DRAFT_962250 [Marasmius fiardii PR-910]|nr:hypothetical protein L218DRAFT_962250 [Marasmius fiardii PR-910]